jgi:beta-glucosidase
MLSLTAARESIVLLKNDKSLLPLRKDIKKLAVIGPNADVLESLMGNYNGTPSKYVTPLAGIRSKVSPQTEVLFAPGTYKIGATTVPVPSASLGTGLKGEYFDNREMKGEPVLTRVDQDINFDWGAFSPAPQLTPQNFSVRWTGKLIVRQSGKYVLGGAGNGGMRVYVDGKVLVEELTNRRTKVVTKEIDLEAGRSYDIRFDYYVGTNTFAAAKLVWSAPNGERALREEAINTARQADAVVIFLGLSPLVEGEEMEVPFEGFRGGDRTSIDLPKQQEELLKEVQALGKPVVLVLLNGSALAVNWANEQVPAILESWYPGEEGGTAIADVLFGDYNPSGRLPVTFYKSVEQLPPFTDYSMQGRTYRYFKGAPLYGFGFGLSYSKFQYANLRFSAKGIKAGASITVSAEVQNVSGRAGEEVVQLYISDEASSVPVAIRSLAGFNRINLKPGEKRRVSFTLTPRQMSVIDDNGRRVIEPGKFMVSIGGRQPDLNGRAQTGEFITGDFVVAGRVTEVAEK